MTRGGAARAPREGPERRCVATGARGETAQLIRFALSPEGVVTADLAEKLPGRGVWVAADAAALRRAMARNLFARGFRAPATAPQDLPDRIESGLARRLIEALGFARKAGQATSGFDKTRARLRAGPVGALIEASDGSEAQRAKLRPLAGDAPVIAVLTAAELGLAFGREFVIHAVTDAGGATDRAVREARRLAGFRAAQDGAAASAIGSPGGRERRDPEAAGGREGRDPMKDGS